MQFEKLEVWKRSKILSVDMYRAMVDVRDFGFRDQLTRSALSIPSNIAEGFERDYPKDCLRFLSYAKGSCGELRTQLMIGIEIGYVECDAGSKWIQESKEISSMLAGLIKARKKFEK
jgi:four helix bundle protein